MPTAYPLCFLHHFLSNKNTPTTLNFLIAGLGNVGVQYDHTRHNIGFDVLDFLAKQHNAAFTSDRLAAKAQIRIKGRTLHLIKPGTYMNLSGKAVRYWMQATKTTEQQLLVVLDDLALPFGKLRLRGKGSDGGHNGLKSIDELLGNNNYARLRFGIGSNYAKGKQADFVLSPWSDEEKIALPQYLEKAADTIVCFALEGLERAMNKFN
ncbi:aminoacyl-tRNA hydrolase [Sphingobacteriales bacterium UPWRP_1]|nr:aminoacyl-tRNA hydrolase [Sphingobacteriales bacterium TSM_CSM]PSJ74976.1 aminoacyl-tRNA hydrolase [Sphingobacteriales bacterium UPWRP_1]